MTTINFNGKTYNSLEEMPDNERQVFQHMQQIFGDANGNGIPDFMEGNIANNVITALTSNINFNGKVYTNMNDLPPEAQEKMQRAFDKLKQFGLLNDSQISQIQMASNFASQPATISPASFEPAFKPSTPMISQPVGAQNSGSGTNWMLIAAILAALLVCVVAVAAVAIYSLR